MSYPITAVILTKNEEKNIERCLLSVAFCNDIVLVDDNSTDNTVQVAKKCHARVIERALHGDFANQRNFALTLAREDWILYIDADEVVTPGLKKEIVDAVSPERPRRQEIHAFYIKRRDFWWGKELKFGETQKVRNFGIIRLVRRNSGQWMGNVHEIFYTAKHTEMLQSFLNHHPHPSVREFIQDINEYSTLRARELIGHGKKTNIVQIIWFPLGKFILNYVFYFGFLDGARGFAYAFFMSFHSFLVRAKLYQYTQINTH